VGEQLKVNIQRVYFHKEGHMLVVTLAHGIDIRIPIGLENTRKLNRNIEHLEKQHREEIQRYLKTMAEEHMKIVGALIDMEEIS